MSLLYAAAEKGEEKKEEEERKKERTRVKTMVSQVATHSAHNSPVPMILGCEPQSQVDFFLMTERSSYLQQQHYSQQQQQIPSFLGVNHKLQP